MQVFTLLQAIKIVCKRILLGRCEYLLVVGNTTQHLVHFRLTYGIKK